MSTVAIIIQARLGSSRLPKKVIKTINNLPIIEHLINRLLGLNLPIYLAVPHGESQNFSFLEKKNITLFEGDEENVLKRYYDCANQFNINNIIRVTADNPLTSEFCINYGLNLHLKETAHLTYIHDIPYGAGVEYITFKALELCHLKAKKEEEREHITTYIYNNPSLFYIQPIDAPKTYKSNLRVTIDTLEDFNRYKQWVKTIGLEKEGFLSLEKVLDYVKSL